MLNIKDTIDNIRQKHQQKQDEKLRYEFLPSALEIEQTPPSPLGEKVVIGIALIILVCIIYASISKVDMVAIARGKIIPNGRVKVIQVIEEGIITGIYVDEGEKVTEGQLLIDLDKTIKQVDQDTIKDTLNTLEAEKDVLEQYVDNTDVEKIKKYINSKDLTPEIKISLLDFILSKQESYQTKKSLLELSIAEQQSNINLAMQELESQKLQKQIYEKDKEKIQEVNSRKTLQETELDKIQKNIDIAKQEESKYKELLDANAVPKQEYEDKKNARVLLEQEYQIQQTKIQNQKDDNTQKEKSITDNIDLIKSNISKQELEIQNSRIKLDQEKQRLNNLDKEEKAETQRQILEKQKQIQENKNLIIKANTSLNLQSIKSPVNGTVSSLGVNTIGGVVSPSQSIMSIVPEDTQLIIEATVQNKDIGFIHKDQEVSIKIDTFSFQKYGIIPGVVEKISPDAYEDEKQGLVYKVKVKLNQDYIMVDGEKVKLTSGMGVTVEIKTGKRRVIEFLIEPLVKYVDVAFKLR